MGMFRQIVDELKSHNGVKMMGFFFLALLLVGLAYTKDKKNSFFSHFEECYVSHTSLLFLEP
jgi:hypothetical protein